MGSDMYYEARRSDEDRGRKYVKLKSELCKILGLECEFSVNGPGDDRGPSDEEVLQKLRTELSWRNYD